MGWAISTVSEPESEPISLDYAKRHCRIDIDAEDALVSSWIVGARQFVEDYSSRSVATQTLRLSLDRFPCGNGLIFVPRPPLISVSSVSYFDLNGQEQPITSDNYWVDTYSQPGRICPMPTYSWPSTLTFGSMGVYSPLQQQPNNIVNIEFIAGEPGSQPMIQAMLLLIGHWNANREAVVTGTISSELQFAVESLIGSKSYGQFDAVQRS